MVVLIFFSANHMVLYMMSHRKGRPTEHRHVGGWAGVLGLGGWVSRLACMAESEKRLVEMGWRSRNRGRVTNFSFVW